MRFLADDLLEGRGTATRGHEVAAKFMATRFEATGLLPAGDAGTYLQRVPLRSMKTDPGKSVMTWVRAGKAHTLVAAQDYLLRPDPSRHDISAEAPVVFAGFGVTAQEQHYDDYKGIDVHGKIVAVISAAPHFESAIRAHYTSTSVKARNAVAHGAVGLIVLDDPILEEEYPFAAQARVAGKPSFRWLDQNGLANDATSELRGVAFLSLRATRELFEGSRYTSPVMTWSSRDWILTKLSNSHDLYSLWVRRLPTQTNGLIGIKAISSLSVTDRRKTEPLIATFGNAGNRESSLRSLSLGSVGITQIIFVNCCV
jgi:PA domain